MTSTYKFGLRDVRTSPTIICQKAADEARPGVVGWTKGLKPTNGGPACPSHSMNPSIAAVATFNGSSLHFAASFGLHEYADLTTWLMTDAKSLC